MPYKFWAVWNLYWQFLCAHLSCVVQTKNCHQGEIDSCPHKPTMATAESILLCSHMLEVNQHSVNTDHIHHRTISRPFQLDWKVKYFFFGFEGYTWVPSCYTIAVCSPRGIKTRRYITFIKYFYTSFSTDKIITVFFKD